MSQMSKTTFDHCFRRYVDQHSRRHGCKASFLKQTLFRMAPLLQARKPDAD